jgi:hypothetical protein
MAVDVVFAGWPCPLDALPTLISNAAACPSAGLDAMLVGVVFTGNPALTSGADEGLPMLSASSGRRAQSTHATPKMGGSNWPAAAMVPTLSKSAGGNKPQYRVRKVSKRVVGF